MERNNVQNTKSTLQDSFYWYHARFTGMDRERLDALKVETEAASYMAVIREAVRRYHREVVSERPGATDDGQ